MEKPHDTKQRQGLCLKHLSTDNQSSGDPRISPGKAMLEAHEGTPPHVPSPEDLRQKPIPAVIHFRVCNRSSSSSPVPIAVSDRSPITVV